jgi:hypothetical protein
VVAQTDDRLLSNIAKVENAIRDGRIAARTGHRLRGLLMRQLPPGEFDPLDEVDRVVIERLRAELALSRRIALADMRHRHEADAA